MFVDFSNSRTGVLVAYFIPKTSNLVLNDKIFDIFRIKNLISFLFFNIFRLSSGTFRQLLSIMQYFPHNMRQKFFNFFIDYPKFCIKSGFYSQNRIKSGQTAQNIQYPVFNKFSTSRIKHACYPIWKCCVFPKRTGKIHKPERICGLCMIFA